MKSRTRTPKFHGKFERDPTLGSSRSPHARPVAVSGAGPPGASPSGQDDACTTACGDLARARQALRLRRPRRSGTTRRPRLRASPADRAGDSGRDPDAARPLPTAACPGRPHRYPGPLPDPRECRAGTAATHSRDTGRSRFRNSTALGWMNLHQRIVCRSSPRTGSIRAGCVAVFHVPCWPRISPRVAPGETLSSAPVWNVTCRNSESICPR